MAGLEDSLITVGPQATRPGSNETAAGPLIAHAQITVMRAYTVPSPIFFILPEMMPRQGTTVARLRTKLNFGGRDHPSCLPQ
jgi:hypothetical protein